MVRVSPSVEEKGEEGSRGRGEGREGTLRGRNEGRVQRLGTGRGSRNRQRTHVVDVVAGVAVDVVVMVPLSMIVGLKRPRKWIN